MVALQIRDVPDDVHRALVERAAGQGQSLQAFLLHVITNEASRSQNIAMLTRFSHRADGSTLSAADLSDVIDQARTERDRNGATPHRA